MNITGLKIPTGRRQTSWLFTSMTEELNQGPPRNNSSLVVRAGLEPVTSGFQVWHPNHSATLPPYVSGLRVIIVIYFKMTGKWNLSFIPYAIYVHVSHIMTSPRMSNFISNTLSVLCPEIVKNDTQQKIFSDKISCLIWTLKRK